MRLNEAVWMKKMIRAVKILILIFFCIKIASGYECGVKKITRSTALVFGKGTEESYHGEWPWLAALFTNVKEKDIFFCGASLINEWTLISGE